MRKLLLAVAAATMTACGGSSATGTTNGTNTPPTTDTPVATTNVVLANIAFTPASIIVASGATVTFTNNDNIPHNVTFANTAVGTTGNFSTGDKALTMPTAAGAYTYKCTIHGSMTGTVTVR